jgi:class 3 adenylate cyclase
VLHNLLVVLQNQEKNHAKPYVLMYLATIDAVAQFGQDNKEQVHMRVGVHSGSVNCGTVGTTKYKFDIFQMMLH